MLRALEIQRGSHKKFPSMKRVTICKGSISCFINHLHNSTEYFLNLSYNRHVSKTKYHNSKIFIFIFFSTKKKRKKERETRHQGMQSWKWKYLFIFKIVTTDRHHYDLFVMLFFHYVYHNHNHNQHYHHHHASYVPFLNLGYFLMLAKYGTKPPK